MKQVVVAQTNGARMPFAYQDEAGYGKGFQDRFFESGSLGVLQARFQELLVDLADGADTVYSVFIGLLTQHVNVNGADPSYYRDSLTRRIQNSLENKARLRNQTTRSVRKALAARFAPDFGVRLRKQAGGAVTVSLGGSKYILSTALSAAGLYTSSDRAVWLKGLEALGTLITHGRYEMPPSTITDIFGTDGLLQGMADCKFVIRADIVDQEVEVLNYNTYQREKIGSLQEAIDNPNPRTLGTFLNTMLNTMVSIELEFTLDAEEAAYVTQSDTGEINLATLGDFIYAQHEGQFGTIDAPSFVTPLSQVASNVLDSNNGQEPNPRTGVLGLMIKPGNFGFVQLPQVSIEDLEELERQRERSFTDATGEYHRPNTSSHFNPKCEKTVHPGVVRVDWTANLMTLYADGSYTFRDISEWAPATYWQIRRLIAADPTEGFAYTALNQAYRIGAKRGFIIKEALLESGALIGLNPANADYYARMLSKGETFGNLIYPVLGTQCELPQIKEASGETSPDPMVIARRYMKLDQMNGSNPYPILRWLSQLLASVYDAIQGEPDAALAADLGVGIETVLGFRALMTIWNTYGRDENGAVKLRQEDAAARAAYGHQPDDQDGIPAGFVPAALPNVSDNLAMMPHQAKAAYSLERLPKFAILQVAAGGGKTIMIIQDILRKLQAGVVNMPAVYCPAHLIGNYVQDANYACEGKLNVIPINSASVNSFGREYFENLAKARPPNTFFVVDYDFAKLNTDWISYGTFMDARSVNAEWLRSLGIDGIWLDEAHYLKNDSGRSRAMKTAIIDVPYRVLATGTMMQTRIEDVVNQAALLDPGIFGTTERFMREEGENGAGYDFETGQHLNTKAWLASTLQANVCVVKGFRKEWAALLPPRKVAFHWVDLSEAQRKVYQAILEATVDEIKADENLMALLNSQDEDLIDQLDSMLSQYLQRIERFLTAPASDELSVTLQGDDLISPKGKMVGRLVADHMAKKVPGKILCFTSYRDSAVAVYEALPEGIRSQFILYEAERKMECRERFEKDPNIIGMIGVEISMNTGVNAQFASRLIRLESVYSPGTLEQGESRVNRPNIKTKEFRTGIYMDWVLVDRSIDVTKSGRLMSRSVDAAKFYNPHSGAYQSLPDLEPLRMNLDTIMSENSFGDTLTDYLDAYLRLENEVVAREIADYKQRHPNLTFVKQESSGLMAGSKLLKRVPYVSGGDLFSQNDLGLVPLPERLRDMVSRGVDLSEAKGLRVHTDQGDGEIKRVNKSTVQVLLDSGVKASFEQTQVFVVTKTATNAREVRDALANKVGLPVVTDKDVNKVLKTVKTMPVEPEPKRGRKSAPAPVPEDAPKPVIQDVPEVPAGRILLQIRQSMEGGDWIDQKTVPDNQRELLPDEQEEKYRTFSQNKLAAYCRANGLSEDDCDARLVDSEGYVLYSTDGMDDWASLTGQTNKEPAQPAPVEVEVPKAKSGKGKAKDPALPPVVEDEPAPVEDDSPVPEAVEDGGVSLTVMYYNEYFAGMVNAEDPEIDNVDMKSYGFEFAKSVDYMMLTRWQHAAKLKELIQASEFEVPDSFLEALDAAQQALRTNRTHFQQYRHLKTNMADLRNFVMGRRKALKTGVVQPTLAVADGSLFVLLDSYRTPSAAQFKAATRVPGAKWARDDSYWMILSATKKGLTDAVKRLHKDVGIANVDGVKAELRTMTDSYRQQ